jgi:hypothetical protein
MGDSDRLKNYISDYLENSLDPSTQKEFEDTLKRSPELRTMTDRIAALSTQLANLKSHKCSDDFSVKLRERIHTTSRPIISRQNIIRYSFAASFIIILVIVTLTFTNFVSDSPESAPALQGTTQNPVDNPTPVANPASTSKDPGKLVNDGEVDIRSKSNQNAVSDSSRTQREEKKNRPPIKYVDQK